MFNSSMIQSVILCKYMDTYRSDVHLMHESTLSPHDNQGVCMHEVCTHIKIEMKSEVVHDENMCCTRTSIHGWAHSCIHTVHVHACTMYPSCTYNVDTNFHISL